MKNERGYIALLSLLVIGAASVAIATALLLSGTDSQRATIASQQALKARKVADACAEEGLMKLNESAAYTGAGNLTLGDSSCNYTVANTGGTARTISATGTSGNTTRKVMVYVTITTSISITSWQEVI